MAKKEPTPPKEEPRAFTAQEMRKKFLDTIIALTGYWAGEGNSNVPKDMPIRERMDGLVHSFLVMFDGGNGAMPAFDIVCAPHEDDAEYCREQGENWVPPNAVINDCQLHDEFNARGRR